jgi:hypothetical protein
VTYVAESSTDLLNWQALVGSPQVTAIDATWERVSWPVSVAGTKVFCRLRVTRP